MALTKVAMQAFFHDRSNNNIEPTATITTNLIDSNKRTFSIFGKRKSKPEIAKPASAVTNVAIIEPVPLPIPELPDTQVKEIPKPAPPLRKATRPVTPDVDDELREHLQREGMTFLAFTDPAKVAAVAPEPADKKRSLTPIPLKTSSHQVKSLLADVPPLPETKNTGEAMSKAQKSISIPTNSPPWNTSSVPETKPKVSTFSVPQSQVSNQKTEKSTTPGIITTASDVKPAAQNSVGSKIEPSLSPTTKSEQTQPTQHKKLPVNPSVPIERKASDKSMNDSGKDVESDSVQQRPLRHSVANDSPNPGNNSGITDKGRTPIIITPPPAPETLVQDDRRPIYRDSGNYGSHQGPPRQRPQLDFSLNSVQGQQIPNRHLQVGNRVIPSNEGGQPQRRPTTTDGPPSPRYISTSDENTPSPPDVSEERPRAFSLPVPVMLPPSSYSAAPNNIQLSCVTDHRHSVQCSNLHHRIMCMVCQTDSPSERWSCSYCALRFCSKCKEEFISGKNIAEIIKQTQTEEWQVQSAPTSPVGNIGRNIHWELACVLEAGGRFGRPFRGRRPLPPMHRRRSPPHRMNGDGYGMPRNPKWSVPSLSPDEIIPKIQNHPPSSSSSDNGKSLSIKGGGHKKENSDFRSSEGSLVLDDTSEAEKRVSVDRLSRDSRKMHVRQSVGRCSTAAISGGSPAEQRRALLGGGL